MKFLIDTHTFLWFVSGSAELSQVAREHIENGYHDIYISIASLWEISIKSAIGRLPILGEYETVIDDVINNEIEILPINFSHTLTQYKLPFYHRDPFDRIIVSQAIIENMNLISCDTVFDIYLENRSIKRIW